MAHESSPIQTLLFLILLAIVGSWSTRAQSRTQEVGAPKRPEIGGDFALTDQTGGVFRLSDQRGKVVLLFFGYTSCPEACPTMLTKLTGVYKALGTRRDGVLTAFVSVDPERDTPAVLGKYMHYFGSNAVGLTGRKEEIDSVVRQYGARYEIEQSDSVLGYHIRHSTDLYLIGANGKLIRRFSYTDDPALILAGVEQAIQ